MRQSDYSPDSPTQLAREFNLRFGGHPVTVHAARKWLQGESIPTQEKLRALADWLDVSASWLRFGSAGVPEGEASVSEAPSRVAPRDAKILAALQELDEHHRMIAHDFLRMLVRVSRKQK